MYMKLSIAVARGLGLDIRETEHAKLLLFRKF